MASEPRVYRIVDDNILDDRNHYASRAGIARSIVRELGFGPVAVRSMFFAGGRLRKVEPALPFDSLRYAVLEITDGTALVSIGFDENLNEFFGWRNSDDVMLVANGLVVIVIYHSARVVVLTNALIHSNYNAVFCDIAALYTMVGAENILNLVAKRYG